MRLEGDLLQGLGGNLEDCRKVGLHNPVSRLRGRGASPAGAEAKNFLMSLISLDAGAAIGPTSLLCLQGLLARMDPLPWH